MTLQIFFPGFPNVEIKKKVRFLTSSRFTTIFNPILHGGGLWPRWPKTVCRFRRNRARLTKIHDFVPFGTRQMPDKPFLEFFLKVSENWASKIFRGPRALGKKSKNRKKSIFFARNLTFSGWIFIVYVLSFLLRYTYNTSVAQNLKFRPFLAWKISFLTIVIWQLVAAKVYHIEGCFGCLWEAKDQNIYLGASLGW